MIDYATNLYQRWRVQRAMSEICRNFRMLGLSAEKAGLALKALAHSQPGVTDFANRLPRSGPTAELIAKMDAKYGRGHYQLIERRPGVWVPDV
jgi:hypothetical protein